MKLEEIKNYIKKIGIEKQYNESLNLNNINNPNETFYSAFVVSDYYKLNLELNYYGYYTYLFKKFNNEDGFIGYLKKIAEKWNSIDSNIDIKLATAYLLKIYVVSPIDGKIKEENVKKNIKKIFDSFKIIEPTKEQDATECWDLKICNEKINFCLQVKPISFFKSLKTTSKYSFKENF